MELKDYQRYSEITRGLKKSELVLKNAKIVNVFTGEIIAGDLAIEDGVIVGIGSYEGKTERDMSGQYICP